MGTEVRYAWVSRLMSNVLAILTGDWLGNRIPRIMAPRRLYRASP